MFKILSSFDIYCTFNNEYKCLLTFWVLLRIKVFICCFSSPTCWMEALISNATEPRLMLANILIVGWDMQGSFRPRE